MQKQYRELYNTVEELREAYYMTKHKLFPERYQYLQDMITTFMNRVGQLGQRTITETGEVSPGFTETLHTK